MDKLEFERGRTSKAFASDKGAARRAHALLRSALSTHYVGSRDQLGEDFIASALSTSRNAVRSALHMLVRDGLITRQPHNGTRVVREMVRASVDGHLFLGMSTAEALRRVTIEELECREVAMAPLIGRVLQLSGDMMLVSEHLVRLDGEPICIDSGYQESGVPASRWDIGHDQNNAFEDAYGVGVGDCERTFQAIIAGANSAKLLNIAEGAPLLLQETLMTDVNGRARELRFAHYRADRVSMVATSRRASSTLWPQAIAIHRPQTLS
jgi:GntR family transcriptional regulator